MRIDSQKFMRRQLEKEYELESCSWVPSHISGMMRKLDPKITFEEWLKEKDLLEDI